VLPNQVKAGFATGRCPMRQHAHQHSFPKGHRVYLAINIVALGLALGSQAAAAKECQRETPLPADVHLIPPSPEVPEALARFAGAWTGGWEATGGLCHTLVVEEVFANGYARVIPYMSGVGGDLVVLLPNGVSAFRLADGHDYQVDTMVLAGEAIRPFPCPAESGAASPPAARQPLTAGELHAELAGHTLYRDPVNVFPLVLGGHLTIHLTADGVLYGTLTRELGRGTKYDVGTWHITAVGQFCSRWNVVRGRREGCFTVYREGETFAFYRKGRLDKGVYRCVPANPESY